MVGRAPAAPAPAAPAADIQFRRERGHFRRRDVLMTEQELNAVLNQPFFTQPMTLSSVSYRLYRGRSHAKVLTLRFNLIPSFDKGSMVREVLSILDDYFNLQTRIFCSMRYDLVLCNLQAEPPSYYLWRANTNYAEFDENNEMSLAFTHANIFRFCHTAADVHIPDLNIYFSNSKVVIDRCLAIVLSFVV